MFNDTLRSRGSVTLDCRRVVTATLGTALFAAPAAAHGTSGRAVGVAFPTVVVASVAASLFGGGLVFAAVDRLPRSRGAVPLPLLALGSLSVLLAVGAREAYVRHVAPETPVPA